MPGSITFLSLWASYVVAVSYVLLKGVTTLHFLVDITLLDTSTGGICL